MARTNVALTVAGAAVAAAAAGWALGVLFPPASGLEVGRGMAWRTDGQWRAAARASARLLARAVARAGKELGNRNTHMIDVA